MNKPRPGFCSPVTITRVIDADTIEVELTRKFNVRLIHENDEGKQFNAPEINTEQGQKAKKFVKTLLEGADISTTTLFVPTGEDDKLMDVNSFNRILGEIWIADQRLTDILLLWNYGELK